MIFGENLKFFSCKNYKTKVTKRTLNQKLKKLLKKMEHFQALYDKFIETIPKNIKEFKPGKDKMSLPILTPNDLITICYETGKLFKSEKSLLKLEAPVTIVGDIHGHIMDLYYILNNFGLPPETNYLFLGDLVDRGEFSIECVSLVFLMKLLFPKNVFLIRGNHEFLYQCEGSGFGDQLKKTYEDNTLLAHFISVFNFIPLGAIIGDQFLCVHGGIGPDVENLDSIDSVKRPIPSYGNSVVDSLTWSDPDPRIPMFRESRRGLGFLFGKDAVDGFHSKNGTHFIVRGHECIMEGFEPMFDAGIITVFSASNYCGISENKAAVLIVYDECLYEPKIWDPLPYVLRTQVSFVSLDGKKRYLRKTIKPFNSTKLLPSIDDYDSYDESLTEDEKKEKEKEEAERNMIIKSNQPLIRIPITSSRVRTAASSAQIRTSKATVLGFTTISKRMKIKKHASYQSSLEKLPFVIK